MYYSFSLRLVGIVVGVALVAAHLLAVFKPDAVRAFLTRLPRWHAMGVALMTVNLAWAWYIAYVMDWGEFETWRSYVLVFLPLAYIGMVALVHEFLAARAVGIFLLLAAMPMLDAAFMQPQLSRLLLVVLAYAWVVLGLFWTSSPHLLRDHVHFLLKSPGRWMIATWGGVAYGVLVLVSALRW